MAIENAILTIDESVQKAATDATIPAEEKKEEVVAEKAVEQTAAELEQQQAMELFNALRDPARGNDLIKFLAEQAGLLTKAGATEEVAVKSTVDILKESLGEDYGFLADKLAPAIEKMLDAKVGEKTKSVEESVADIRRKEDLREVGSAWDKLNGETDGALDKYGDELAKLTAKYPYDPSGGSVSEYLGDMLKLASDGEVSTKVEKTIERINKNAKEAKVASSDVDTDRVSKSNRLPTLEESVNAALAGKKL